jgi:hypothetical protein
MRYDYGNYVDKEGNTIPAYCMIEKDSNGSYFADPETKGLYAYWTILAEGCNTIAEDELKEYTANPAGRTILAGYNLEDYNNTKVVRIWRTPPFDNWYKNGYLETNGTISGIEHFSSACITIKGEEADDNRIKWTENNESCLLVPDGTNGINILESSNGRNAAEELVLRFSAVIKLSPKVYDFNNAHMIALSPSERRNVTDSYVQIQAIFGERAKDCQEGDAACTTTNGGE